MNVFISYRSQDRSAATALHDALARHLGPEQVFFAEESLRAGESFATSILRRLQQSRILLAVIGPTWLTKADSSGSRLIDGPNDWVHREIAEALHSNISVVPVLVDDAQIPTQSELPGDIRHLAQLQYLRVDSRSLNDDALRIARLRPLLDMLEPIVRSPEDVQAVAEDWLLSLPALTPAEVLRTGQDPGNRYLIRIPDKAGQIRLPAFQFDSSGQAIPVVMRINGVLNAEDDPWGAADWWLWPNAKLDAVPAQLVGRVNDDMLVAAAEAEVAEV